MPAGVRHRIKGAMRRFFWSGSDAARGGGGRPCRLEHSMPASCTRCPGRTSSATHQYGLLSKWVIRVMKPSNDKVSILLREAYGQSLDWSLWATPRQGDSPVVAGIRWIFPLLQSFFRPQLGDGASFRFWENDWSGLG